MSAIQPPRSDEGLKDLGREITSDAVRLVRAEINLARAELADTLKGLRSAIVLLAATATILLFTMVAVLGAFADGVGGKFLGSAWKGWGILAVVFLLAAAFLGYRGYRAIRRSIGGARNAVGTLKEDATWVKLLIRRSGKES